MANITQKLKTAIANPSFIPYFVRARLATQFSYKFCHLLGAWAFAPETINIYPTMRCNLKCAMCFVKFYKAKTELGLDQWLRIIDQLKFFHPRIHLSGGEPFIYPEIIELIAHIKKNHLFLHITTNGTFLSNYAEMIVDLKVNRLDISIDGPREIHDKLRGVAGSYDRILNGLNKIKNFKKGRRLPVIKFNSMLNLENPEIAKDLIKLGQELKVETIQFIHPLFLDAGSVARHQKFLQQHLNRKVNYWQKADCFKPKPADLKKTEIILQKLDRPGPIKVEVFPRFNNQELRAYYNMERTCHSIFTGRCQAMWNTATILPDGQIESCPDYVIGNCLKEKFLILWNNNLMRLLRRRIRNHRFFSVCRACCFFYQ